MTVCYSPETRSAVVAGVMRVLRHIISTDCLTMADLYTEGIVGADQEASAFIVGFVADELRPDLVSLARDDIEAARQQVSVLVPGYLEDALAA